MNTLELQVNWILMQNFLHVYPMEKADVTLHVNNEGDSKS